MIWVGLAIMIVSEAATIARVEPFWSWNTPIAWTGFIIFADAIVWRARGDSWLRSAPREFALLALVSILLWVMFEGFNLVIRNWHYVGLPENPALRYFGYAWSFATIWPALFVGADLIAVARARPSGSSGSGGFVGSGSRGSSGFREPADSNPTNPPDLLDPRGSGALDPRELSTRAAIISIAAGAAMLASPFVVPARLAPFMAAPVWLGFIFLLDPINARLGAESLWADWRAGRRDRLINLMLSGFLCGVLWEFWNYWARAKWIYSVPIMERLKIFEMPLPGYFGFPAFALECFTLYVFLRRLVTRRGRPIAL